VPRLYLVRHAEAAGGWADGADPRLSPRGVTQAEAMADRLAPLGPLPLITSPLRRARETAGALEGRWHTMGLVEPGVGEVPSPTENLAERQAWLQQALRSTWTELGPRYKSWRTMVTRLVMGLPQDTVVVTHYVLVNAVLGVAAGDDRVAIAPVGNASVTVVDVDHHKLTVVDGPGPSGRAGGDPGETGPVL
jgi:broad specificity phosphatase PhoE